MKKLLKVLAVLAAACLVLIAAAGIVLRVYFPPERIKALILAEAEKTLKRKVEIGSVELGIVRGVRVTKVRVGDFLKAEAFTFRFAWLPLLKKRLVAHELALEGLEVTIKKHKDGTTNIPDIQGAGSPPQPSSRKREQGGSTAQTAAGALAVTVESIRLKDARLRYIDVAAKSEAAVSVPLAAIHRFKLSGEFPFSAKMELSYKSGKETQKAVLTLDGALDLAGMDQKNMKGDIRELSVRTGAVTVSGSFKFRDAASPKIEGAFDLPALEATAVNALAPGALPEGVRLPALRVSFSAASEPPAVVVPAFKLEAAGLSVSGKLAVSQSKAGMLRLSFEAASNTFDIAPLADIHPATRGKGLAGKASFKAVLGKTGDTLDLKDVSLTFNDAQASLSGRVGSLSAKEPTLDLALKTGTISFSSFASYLPAISQLTGKARLDAAVKGTPSAPKVSGTLELADAGAEYLKQKLDRFTGAIRFSETSVEVPKLTGRVNGGDLTLRLSASEPNAPVVTVNGSLSVLDAGALEALMSQTPGEAPPEAGQAKPEPYTGPILKTSGNFSIERITHPNFSSGKAVLDWNLSGVTPEFKLMNGSARLRVGSGKAVKLLKLARQKGGLSRAMVLPLELIEKARGKVPGFKPPSLEEIDFERIEGDYTFTKGVMAMQPSLLDGPELKAETRGNVDLPAKTVDLRTVVNASTLGNIALFITGPMDDPSIRPDLTKVKEKVAEEGKKLLKKQGEKLLKGLLNR